MCSVRSFQQKFPPPADRPISEPAAQRKREETYSRTNAGEITPDMRRLPGVEECLV